MDPVIPAPTIPVEQFAEALKQRPLSKAEQVRQVFAHWQEAMGHPRAQLDAKRERAITARLDTYSVEELKQAIDGCKATPHNMGQNDRGERYDDIELICRDAGHVDRFLRNARAPPRPGAANGQRGGYIRAEDYEKNRPPPGELKL